MKRTKVLKSDKRNIIHSARVLKDGGLVAFPTETVYGLGASILDGGAIERLYKIKRRPRNKPFAILTPDLKIIKKMGCKIDKRTKTLTEKFWPGPLTIILKAKNGERMGFRMPDNKVALELLRQANVPIACSSANISGRRPPKDGQDVLKNLDGKIDILLDGGRADIGVESTVIDLVDSPPKVLREGAISEEEILRVIGHG